MAQTFALLLEPCVSIVCNSGHQMAQTFALLLERVDSV
jgi:hypothetical protein